MDTTLFDVITDNLFGNLAARFLALMIFGRGHA